MPEQPKVSYNFTSFCMVCGREVEIVDGREQPHRCRIDLDAQKGIR